MMVPSVSPGSMVRSLLVLALLTAAAADDGRGGMLQDGDVHTATARAAGIDSAGLAGLVDRFFASEMEENHIPGGVFLLVRNGEVVHGRGYGFADLERGRPVDVETTVWRVGSNSKTLTALAALQLVDRGLARLDEDVNSYLKRFKIPDTYPEPVTVYHLLTHTAGFDERLFGQHVADPAAWQPLGEYLGERLPPRILPPGRVISYNDHGTSLAGFIVEEVTGVPFPNFVRENVFRPLGLAHSGFEPVDLSPEVRENLAVAYRWTGDGHVPYAYDPIITYPAAGLMMSAADMGRFLTALLQGGRLDGARVLGDSLTREMLAVQFRHHPRLRGRAFGFVESDDNGVYGLYKDGQATGFTARIFVLPEHGIAFFSAVNLSIFGPRGFNAVAGFHRRLTSQILDHFFPDDSLEQEEAGEGSVLPARDFATRAHEFEGFYRPMEGSRHTLEKVLFLFQGDIEVRDNGDGSLAIGFGRWVEVEPRFFQWHEGGPYYRAFGTDESGQISHLFIGPGAFERIPFIASQTFTLRAHLIFAALFLSAILVWPLSSLARRKRPGSGVPHPGRWPLVTVAALHLAFMIGFVGIFLLSDFQRFFKGVPPSLAALLALPIVASAISLLLPFYSTRAWRRGSGSLASRIYYSALTVAMLLFIPLLHYWNMLGWRY